MLRQVVNRGLTPKAVAALADFTRAMVIEFLDRIEPGQEYDLVEEIGTVPPAARN